MEFDQLFLLAMAGKDVHPFPYQCRLATEPWPELLEVPTGLGKTAGVILAWIYKRLQDDPATPWRLVYCLPMRTLVEQTAADARTWLGNIRTARPDSAARIPSEPHILMGGETDDRWIRSPELPAILIGTQDVLLSRALMRGYGVGRSRWPVDFALLHNDAMWVFDEVQLMAGGAPTSAQLEGFRRKLGTLGICRSIWMSATLERDWLKTVDFDAPLVLHGIEPGDRSEPTVRNRLAAPKSLRAAATGLAPAALGKAGLHQYVNELAREILLNHETGKTTLAILNRVNRAQGLYEALRQSNAPPLLLVHSRFRPAERRKLNQQLLSNPGERGRIIVATQAIEAGVDLTSAMTFTELAPWSSLVQRFGRLNRRAEEPNATAFWIDIVADDEKEAAALALPYASEELDAARKRLSSLTDASARTLEAFGLGPRAAWQVLRRRDLYALFDTDPDLTGFDVDVSPYVRGADDTDVRVFWRDIADIKQGPQGSESNRPHRDEVCAVPIGRARDWLKNHGGRAFIWDWLGKRWTRLDRPWPGGLVLVDAGFGGYDGTLGFDPASKVPVLPVVIASCSAGADARPEGSDDDRDTIGNPVALSDHLRDVHDEVARLCAALQVPPDEAAAATTAGLWHDLAKAHDVFLARCGLPSGAPALAKTPDYNWRIKDVRAGSDGRKRDRNRKQFRHELASMLAWLQHGPQNEAHDLIAYLIAAHHGKVRMGLRALPDERGPDGNSDIRFARGVWDGDQLPPFSTCLLAVPETVLELDVMELGGGATGQSWAARTHGLLERYGPFRLAFLEALVRLADWRASAAVQASLPGQDSSSRGPGYGDADA